MQIDLENVIKSFRRMVVLNSPSNEEHATRTGTLAAKMGERLRLDKNEMLWLRYGADVHDIGKIFIDSSILNKPGRLNKAQRAQIEKHSELGFEAIELIGCPRQILDAVMYHHEHFDGSGYPRKLKGDAIPLFARVICIADMWDALNSDRPYRPCYSSAKALEVMAQHTAWFDPRLFALFLGILREDGLSL